MYLNGGPGAMVLKTPKRDYMLLVIGYWCSEGQFKCYYCYKTIKIEVLEQHISSLSNREKDLDDTIANKTEQL